MHRPFALAAILTCGAAPLDAQGSVAGTWRSEFDAQVHVAVHGDSLVGTEHWVSVDHASQGTPRRFTATRKP